MDEKDLLSMFKRRETFIKNCKQDNADFAKSHSITDANKMMESVNDLTSLDLAIIKLQDEIISQDMLTIKAYGEAIQLLLDTLDEDVDKSTTEQIVSIFEKAGIGHEVNDE